MQIYRYCVAPFIICSAVDCNENMEMPIHLVACFPSFIALQVDRGNCFSASYLTAL